MADEKTFDKADLLKFFSDSGPKAEVGTLTVIRPGKTLYDDADVTKYPVEARTEALWCEKYSLAFVVRSVEFPMGGATALNKEHWLRQGRITEMRDGNGANSAELARWAVDLAATWREDVTALLPVEVDLRPK